MERKGRWCLVPRPTMPGKNTRCRSLAGPREQEDREKKKRRERIRRGEGKEKEEGEGTGKEVRSGEGAGRHGGELLEIRRPDGDRKNASSKWTPRLATSLQDTTWFLEEFFPLKLPRRERSVPLVRAFTPEVVGLLLLLDISDNRDEIK